MSSHPEMENGSELCHWKGELIVGLCVDPVRPCKSLQISAKLGAPRGSTTRRTPPVKAPRAQTDMSRASMALPKASLAFGKAAVINIAARPNLRTASEFQQPSSGMDRPSNFDGCTPARNKISPGLRPGKFLKILAVAGALPARVCCLPVSQKEAKYLGGPIFESYTGV